MFWWEEFFYSRPVKTFKSPIVCEVINILERLNHKLNDLAAPFDPVWSLGCFFQQVKVRPKARKLENRKKNREAVNQFFLGDA